MSFKIFVAAAFLTAAVGCGAATPSQAGKLEAVARKSIVVDGIRIFYREAGSARKPTILLLHGFPTSSLMYRDVIPLLAPHFHLIAPDYPGFGLSDAPGDDRFQPKFASLARLMSSFAQDVGATSYILYVQDYGGPVGYRIARDHPERVRGLIIQNANAYAQGVAAEKLATMEAWSSSGRTPAQDAQIDSLLSAATPSLLYKAGARDPDAIDPAVYRLDAMLFTQPAQRRIQRGLIIDYYDNIRQYPAWQAYFRRYQPKTLIVWGKNDPVFLPAGAEAYLADLPAAKLRFLPTGHFALEEEAPAIARLILETFRR